MKIIKPVIVTCLMLIYVIMDMISIIICEHVPIVASEILTITECLKCLD